MNGRNIKSYFGAMLIGVMFGIGCSRKPAFEYVVREDVRELPRTHQSTIRDILIKFYGTPVSPRLMVPKRELDENGDAILIEHLGADRLKQGSAVFQRRCASCHGTTGDGNGEAAEYLNPKPRDYRLGKFKFTSTPYDFRPRRQDLMRTIRRGAKGTSMPSFRWLSNEDLKPLVDYVIYLSYRGELELTLGRELAEYDEDEELEEGLTEEFAMLIHQRWAQAESNVVLPDTPPPLYNEASIKAGREIFLLPEPNGPGCYKCHGRDGRGQTEWLSPEFIARQESSPPEKREQINRDAWGNVAPAADLTAGMLHGGRRPIDVYRKIYSGITGTPMPAFANKFVGEDRVKIWHLAHFVISLTEGREFEIDEQPGSGGGSSP